MLVTLLLGLGRDYQKLSPTKLKMEQNVYSVHFHR